MNPIRTVHCTGMVIALALALPAAAQIAPVGEEVSVVGTPPSRVTAPTSAFDRRGEILLVWEARWRGLEARRLDSTGHPVGGELELAVSDMPTDFPYRGPTTLHRDPSVVSIGRGQFLVTWTEEVHDVVVDIFYYQSEIRSRRVLAQRFDRAGEPLGPRIVLSEADGLLHGAPQAARLSDGSVLVAWQATGFEEEPAGAYGRLLGRHGAPVGSVFRVDSILGLPARRPAVAGTRDGGFLVVWQGCCDSDGAAVFAQRFRAGGQPVGEPFRVNTVEGGNQAWPALARGASGELLVVWMGPSDTEDGPRYRIRGQKLAPDGALEGPELPVSEGDARAHGAPAVVATERGFMVAWTVWGTNFPYAIEGVELEALGGPGGEVLSLSHEPTGIQWKLSLVRDGRGHVLAAWEGFSPEGDPSINTRLLEETLAGPRSAGIAPAGD